MAKIEVDLDVGVDLDALWASMAASLKARGVRDVEALARAQRLFWEELGAADDWLEVTTAPDSLELVGVLRPAFERRFIAKAMRSLGLKYVRAA